MSNTNSMCGRAATAACKTDAVFVFIFPGGHPTMGVQTARGPLFPTACAKCGTRLSEPVNFCPRCGAQARHTSGESAPRKKPDAAPGAGLWTSRPTFPSGPTNAAPYRDARSPLALLRLAERRGVKAGIALVLVAIVAIAGAVMLLHRHDDLAEGETQAASNTAQGSVTADGTSQSRQLPPTATAQQNAAASQPAPAPGAMGPQSQSPSSLSQRETASAPDSTATAAGSGGKNQRLMTLALARARAGLEKNDLRMARSGVYWALSLQHDNSDALMLKQELLSRETGRNSAKGAGAD